MSVQPSLQNANLWAAKLAPDILEEEGSTQPNDALGKVPANRNDLTAKNWVRVAGDCKNAQALQGVALIASPVGLTAQVRTVHRISRCLDMFQVRNRLPDS